MLLFGMTKDTSTTLIYELNFYNEIEETDFFIYQGGKICKII